MIYHEQSAAAGLGPSHRLIIDMVPPGSLVLDLGCSSGYLAQALGDLRGCRVIGVEMDATAAELARDAGIDVIEGSLTDQAVREQLGHHGPFDTVVAADVLEHLLDPGEALDWIRQDLLTPSGALVASIPNVANFTVRKQLLLGRFEYTDHGLLDRTHLRFFTAASLRRFLADHHYDVSRWEIAADTYPYDRVFASPPWLWRIKRRVNRAMLGRFPNLIAFQFVFAATPRKYGQ